MRKLKEKFILSYFERKKRKEPFDAETAEHFQLKQEDGININNSHFFTAGNASGETLSIRLGMRNHSDYEIFVLYRSRDGRFFVHEKDHYEPEECPVRFRCLKTAETWEVSFDGNLLEPATSQIKPSHIKVLFKAEYPIYDFVYHADVFTGMARAIAREKWNKAFFAELSRNDQRHYEQAGRVSGDVVIGDESFGIDLCCVRDHSFGCREWDMMNDHIWLLGITKDDKVLSFSIVNYPSLKRIYSGYTDFFGDRMETLRDYEILSYDDADGKGSDVLRLRCYFSEGRSIEIEISRDCNVKCIFGGGCYAFQEGLASFSINGVPGRGTLEYGYNGNPSRWEDYSKL